jgi:putative ABC transport system permease protein
MIVVVLRGLLGRKLRAALTAIAIVLGVAMIAGTYVLMDTTMRAFDEVFETAYSKTDASVVGKSPFGVMEAVPPPVSAGLLERIRRLPEVQAAEGFVEDSAQLRDAQGDTLAGTGYPLAFGITPGSTFNPLEMTAGREPAGPGEIALDEKTAHRNGFRTGSRIGVAARGPLEWFRVVGLFRFGGVESLGPVQMLVCDLPVAQRLFDKQGLYDHIDVRARDGVKAVQLTRAIADLLPATAEVKTREERVDTSTSAVGDGMAIVRYILLAFGGVALFVGSFVIFNTLSITVAQRMRELATLRTLGASRRQVLGSILLEGSLIGALASLIGLVGGLALAKGLSALFESAGVELPRAGLVFAPRTVVVSLAVGMLVTLAASLLPGLRAMRVPPIAAVREGAVPPTPMHGRTRDVLAWAGIVGGFAVLALATLAAGLATAPRLLLLATGAVLLFLGAAPFSRRLVPPLSLALGKPIEAVTGVSGELARENSKRDPGRTAVTAGALTVGLALVVFVAVLGHGLRTTVRDAVEEQVRADYVIRADAALLSPAVEHALRGTPVVAAAGVRAGNVRSFEKTQLLTGVDPGVIARFYRFEWSQGSSAAALRRLGGLGVIVRDDVASAHDLALGSRFTVETTFGKRLALVVRGIYDAPTFDPLLGAMTVSTDVFDRGFPIPSDVLVFVDTGGATAGHEAAVTSLLDRFPAAKVRTLDGFIASQQASIGTLLNLFYVLLALSVVVSLFGIVNTLALSIVERTREIGVLRAIGMTRAQLTRMIRIESEITALIGAVVGIVVGIALAWVTTLALASWDLSFGIPWGTILVLALAAFLAGLAAGVVPARRAAHLNPLRALHYE